MNKGNNEWNAYNTKLKDGGLETNDAKGIQIIGSMNKGNEWNAYNTKQKGGGPGTNGAKRYTDKRAYALTQSE